MKEIKITVRAGENFTPAQLMKRYADQTAGVEFQRSVYGNAKLSIEGSAYYYHRWKISGEAVTLYLLECERYDRLNNMCRCCTRLDQDCEGTSCQTWTGCALKVRAEA